MNLAETAFLFTLFGNGHVSRYGPCAISCRWTDVLVPVIELTIDRRPMTVKLHFIGLIKIYPYDCLKWWNNMKKFTIFFFKKQTKTININLHEKEKLHTCYHQLPLVFQKFSHQQALPWQRKNAPYRLHPFVGPTQIVLLQIWFLF